PRFSTRCGPATGSRGRCRRRCGAWPHAGPWPRPRSPARGGSTSTRRPIARAPNGCWPRVVRPRCVPETGRRDSVDGAFLARGAFLSALAFLTSNLRGIFTFLVARLLGGAVLGTFGLAWATTDLVSKIGTFGLDTSAIAFVALAEVTGDRARSRRIMRAALAIALGVSALLAGGGCWVAWRIAPRLGLREE